MLIKTLFDGQLPEMVVFDLDGTLVDSVPDLALAVDAMLNELGASSAGEDHVRVWVGNGASVLVQRALAYAGLAVDQHEALDCFKRHYANYLNVSTQIYPDVLSALDQLRLLGVRMAVVTNKPEQFTQPLLEALGLSEYFDEVLSGDSLPAKKPDPLPLLHLCEKYAVPSQLLLMVGDSINDVKAAQSASCVSAVVPYGYHQGLDVTQMGADLVIHRISDLLS